MYYIETLTSTGAGTVDCSTLDPDLNKVLNVPRNVYRQITRMGVFGNDADLTSVALWKGNEMVSFSGVNHENLTSVNRDTMLPVNVSFNDEKIPLELVKAGDVTFTLVLEWKDTPKAAARGYRGTWRKA